MLPRLLQDLNSPLLLPSGETLQHTLRTTSTVEDLIETLLLNIEPRLEDILPLLEETPSKAKVPLIDTSLSRWGRIFGLKKYPYTELATMAEITGILSPTDKDREKLVSGTADYEDVLAFINRLISMVRLTNEINGTREREESPIENLRVCKPQESRSDLNLRSRTGASSALLDTICQPNPSTHMPMSALLPSILSEDCKIFPPEIDTLIQSELERISGSRENRSNTDSNSGNTVPSLSDLQSLLNEENERLVDQQRILADSVSEFDFQERPNSPSSSHFLLQETVDTMIREIANFEKFHVENAQSAVRAFQSGPTAHAHVVSGLGEGSRKLLEKCTTLNNHLGALSESFTKDKELDRFVGPLMESMNELDLEEKNSRLKEDARVFRLN